MILKEDLRKIIIMEKLSDEMLEKTLVIKVVIDEMTGKQS